MLRKKEHTVSVTVELREMTVEIIDWLARTADLSRSDLLEPWVAFRAAMAERDLKKAVWDALHPTEAQILERMEEDLEGNGLDRAVLHPRKPSRASPFDPQGSSRKANLPGLSRLGQARKWTRARSRPSCLAQRNLTAAAKHTTARAPPRGRGSLPALPA
jgi:hypothetical protein